MLNRIPSPSKKTFVAFVLLSTALHLAVCKLPVQSSISHEELNEKVIQVSFVSVAAPSVLGNSNEDSKKQEVKKLSEIQPAAGRGSLPKEQSAEENKTKQFLTSNDNGNNSVTIEPVLTENDYIQTVAPAYPHRAIERGQQGVVIVRALIAKSGQAEKVLVHNSSGFETLDISAIKAVSQWKFKTALAEGMWVQVPVKFIIK